MIAGVFLFLFIFFAGIRQFLRFIRDIVEGIVGFMCHIVTDILTFSRRTTVYIGDMIQVVWARIRCTSTQDIHEQTEVPDDQSGHVTRSDSITRSPRSNSAPDILHDVMDTRSPPPMYESVYPDGPTVPNEPSTVSNCHYTAPDDTSITPVPTYESVCPDTISMSNVCCIEGGQPPSYSDALNFITIGNSHSLVS